MVRRYVAPARANLFDERRLRTWIVAEDPWQRILDVKPLEPGTDLIRVFLTELLKYHDAGWRLNEFSAYGAYFFATKEGEVKRRIYIATTDPAAPKTDRYGSTSDFLR
jgi:hypothetical protein